VRVLVTNDDGIDAPGLHALAGAARDAGFEVLVAAPAQQASGAGASAMAVKRDGRTVVARRELPGLAGVAAWAVDAHPAHIVRAALNGWFDPAPDLVLSGINDGVNTGRAVLHSGTVGAALTAGLSATSALAVSLEVRGELADARWDVATGLVARVLPLLRDAPAATVLSLNVPDRAEPGALRHARLDPRGVVWTRVTEVRDGDLLFGAAAVADPPEEGTDSALLAAGHPTLTALRSVQEDGGDLVPAWLAGRAG
jgi:5'-nucleotidase